MPYSVEHKNQKRAQILECARILFNRHGFEQVTITMVMKAAGLTHGGFYNHFKSKEALYKEAVASFLMGRGAQWRADAGVDPNNPSNSIVQDMLNSYLSTEHLGEIDGQCPMIALPSDVARCKPEVKSAYQDLLIAMVGLFEQGLKSEGKEARHQALVLAALSVGGMVLARTIQKDSLANEIRSASLTEANRIANQYGSMLP